MRVSTIGEALWSPLDGGLSRLELGVGSAPRKKFLTPANISGERRVETAFTSRNGEEKEDTDVFVFTGDSGASASMGMDLYC